MQGLQAVLIASLPAAKLEPLVGPVLARVLYIMVRLGFLLSIITIFPMQVGGGAGCVASRLLVVFPCRQLLGSGQALAGCA